MFGSGQTAMLRDGAEEESTTPQGVLCRSRQRCNGCGGSWLLELCSTGYLSSSGSVLPPLDLSSRQDADARKSSRSALTRSGASSIIQWSTPAMVS